MKPSEVVGTLRCNSEKIDLMKFLFNNDKAKFRACTYRYIRTKHVEMRKPQRSSFFRDNEPYNLFFEKICTIKFHHN